MFSSAVRSQTPSFHTRFLGGETKFQICIKQHVELCLHIFLYTCLYRTREEKISHTELRFQMYCALNFIPNIIFVCDFY